MNSARRSAPDIQHSAIDIDWAGLETEAAGLLARYIQFDTSNPPGNEAPAVEFLAGILRQRGFEPRLIESAPGRANLITRLSTPSGATAPPCLLYTHADVVPAEAAGWSAPPFGGQLKDGFVWGRGAVDNKGLGIIFVQALTLLKQYGPPLNRDIILLIAADEETRGDAGVAWLLDHHADLIEAEYVWDEGGVGLHRSADPIPYLYQVAIAEKGALTVKLLARGRPGHAAVPGLDNPHDHLIRALSRVQRWQQPVQLNEVMAEMLGRLAPYQAFPRSRLYARARSALLWPLLRRSLAADLYFAPLIRNTINLTMLRGGHKSNVIPAEAEATLDIRLLPGEDPDTMLADLRAIINDPKVSVMAEEMPIAQPVTPSDTAFFQALSETLQALGPAGLVTPYLSPGTTDSRFFRQAGMRAYGFVPMILDAGELNRIHGVDERVSTANLRWGAQVVFETLRRL
jgi:acetylornithine deacetylase/succinyl-diaminopimelate desuccinylase-like protein